LAQTKSNGVTNTISSYLSIRWIPIGLTRFSSNKLQQSWFKLKILFKTYWVPFDRSTEWIMGTRIGFNEQTDIDDEQMQIVRDWFVSSLARTETTKICFWFSLLNSTKDRPHVLVVHLPTRNCRWYPVAHFFFPFVYSCLYLRLSDMLRPTICCCVYMVEKVLHYQLILYTKRKHSLSLTL